MDTTSSPLRRTVLLLLFFILFPMNKLYPQHPDFLFLVEQAIKAPSGHNSQPWLFKLNEQSIEIRPNFDRALPVVDFDHRELFISLGCATENLCLAASERGYHSEVIVDGKGIIKIILKKDQAIVPQPLFNQIGERQTNRSVYNGRSIAPDTMDQLKNIPLAPGANRYIYRNGSPEYDTIANFVYRGNTIQMQDQAFKTELRSWMRYNKKHQDRHNDGLSYAVFGAPNLPMFIVKPIMKKAVNEKSQNKGDKKKIESSSHMVLFTVQRNGLQEWIALGRALQGFLLRSTELGIAHAYLNQPNEIRELAEEMAGSLNLPGEYPCILLRIGYGESLPYSKRRAIEEVIIP